MPLLRGMIVLMMGFTAACANKSTTAPAATPQTTSITEPRLTPDDYRGFMKTVGATYPTMRMHLMAGMTAEAAKEAQLLAFTFANVERFWMQNNKPDAIKLAQEARMYAIETAGAATAGDVMKATMTATNMQGMCKQCHGLYREMDPANAGGFRIKPGVISGS